MSETIKATIQELLGQLRALDDEAMQLKVTINLLSKRAGLEPMFTSIERSTGSVGDIKGDTYYGQPLNASIRDYLERRRAAGIGPAAVREIFDALLQGGFQFNAKNEDNAQRSLRVTLSKSTHTFHRLPNGSFGLVAWYPAIKASRELEDGDDIAEAEDATDADDANAEAPTKDEPHPFEEINVTSTTKPKIKAKAKGGDDAKKSSAPGRTDHHAAGQ